MAENGEEKLIAVARHIAKTLGGHTHNMTDDDILRIFSSFDGRLREKFTDKLAGVDHGYPHPRAANLEQNIRCLERQISLYVSADHPIWSDSADVASFLEIVDELISVVRDLTPIAVDKSVSSCLGRAGDLLQQAMLRLEEEFNTLMEQGNESVELRHAGETGKPVYSSDTNESEFEDGEDSEIPVAHRIMDYDIVIEAFPSGIINDLNEIMKRMMAAGHGKECSHSYIISRREFLEESLSRLQVQHICMEEIKNMQWSELEDRIDKWIKAINVAILILFPSERRLCDRVFSGISSDVDLSFMEVCKDSIIQLLKFADSIAIETRSPERLFKVLDVYEAMRELLPEFDMVFSDQYCMFLRNEAIMVWNRLGEAIKGIFRELENLIRHDPVKAAVPGGGLHPITRYVMNYLRAACRSKQTLQSVFEDDRALSSPCPMGVHMTWIMELLENNLEAKSKIYKDSALCSLFKMNNGRYIVEKVKDSELGSLLGDDWIRKHTAKLKQYHINYLRSSWSRIQGVLKTDNNSSSKTLKEKLKSFNSLFEETCRTQSMWMVFDDHLREELRFSVSGILLLAYGDFIGRLGSNLEIRKHIDIHIKYSVEDVDGRITELFCGINGSSGARQISIKI